MSMHTKEKRQAQKHALQAWQDLLERNQGVFKQLNDRDDLPEKMRLLDRLDTTAAWGKILSAISPEQQEVRPLQQVKSLPQKIKSLRQEVRQLAQKVKRPPQETRVPKPAGRTSLAVFFTTLLFFLGLHRQKPEGRAGSLRN
jgi:hypothetical protein